MTWPFNDEHEQLRKSIRDFVEKELAPHADEWEANKDFPDWVFSKLGEAGILGVAYPEEYGGAGGGDCRLASAATPAPHLSERSALRSRLREERSRAGER